MGLFPAGNTPPESGNQQGVADLAGNVSEWCSTRWRETYRGYEKQASDDLSGGIARVVRGGAWWDHVPDFLQSSSRNNADPFTQTDKIGFRVVWVSESAR